MKDLNKKLIKIKYNAFKLKESGQMPTFLFEEIAHLGYDANEDYVKFLMECTEHFIRLKGYYRKYSREELFAMELFKKLVEERGLKQYVNCIK